MDIQLININKLKPATYNPRQINSKQYNDLKTSIMKFGLVDPIIVNKDLTVIGGHQRLKICKELFFKDVDCHILNLNKEQEKELNIRLNKSGGIFDIDILANEFDIDELVEWGFKHIELGLNIDKIDMEKEWQGMPEFNSDDLTPHRQITISFNNEKDIQRFSELIEQTITKKTKSLWYPKAEQAKQFDKVYKSTNNENK